jgi:hypothetical protein
MEITAPGGRRPTSETKKPAANFRGFIIEYSRSGLSGVQPP